MPSAIDVFREQRDAADHLHRRVQEISELLEQLRQQVNAVALNQELRTLLREEQNWLTRAQLAVSEVRSFREQDMLRFWPGVLRRWIVAVAFALASAAAAGAGYAWATKPYAVELATLRSRAEFADFIELRIAAMSAAERQQFEKLLRLNPRRNTRPLCRAVGVRVTAKGRRQLRAFADCPANPSFVGGVW